MFMLMLKFSNLNFGGQMELEIHSFMTLLSKFSIQTTKLSNQEKFLMESEVSSLIKKTNSLQS